MTDLPDFADPPIDEVVLGIQFDAIPAFRAVNTFQVWELFREEFPKVEDVPSLEPQLEIFGGSQPRASFAFGPMSLRPRSWFISSDDTHLIQFQDDRLLLNWRKRPAALGAGHPYPRYESIADRFVSCIDRLGEFFSKTFGEKLRITQAEVSYINTIMMPELSCIGEYLNFIDVSAIEPESFAASFVERVSEPSGKNVARMYHELQTTPPGAQVTAARFTLTVRGKPSDGTSTSARQFLDLGRRRIVTRFCELTTSAAQEKWGRQK